MWLAPDAIATWEAVGVGKRGGQRQYSDLAIETALTLRLIFHLPLRQTEGFLTSIFGMLGLALSAPDHTTLSRRGQHLDLTLRRLPAGASMHLLVDSTGLSIVGEGEWAAAKHGGRGRRGWKKRHLGVDRSGVIVARALTEASVDDATTGITLIEAVDGALGRVTADAAYDTVGFYEAAGARRATVVVPPTRTANVSRYGPRSSARDRTILAVKETGRRRWKQMSGYHGQVEPRHAQGGFHPDGLELRVDADTAIAPALGDRERGVPARWAAGGRWDVLGPCADLLDADDIGGGTGPQSPRTRAGHTRESR